MKIKAGQASSQDFNQSIFCTLNRFGSLNNFWSSNGSDSPDDNEHLSYSISSDTHSHAPPTGAAGVSPTMTVDLGKTA